MYCHPTNLHQPLIPVDACILLIHYFLCSATNSRSRGRGSGFVICGVREEGGIRDHHPAQRTRQWVSIFLSCFSFHPPLSLSLCLALLFLFNIQQHYSSQTEMSSSENENKHKSYRLKCYDNYVIVIVIFWVMSWISSNSLRGKCRKLWKFLQHS